jgi:hypothetical protein
MYGILLAAAVIVGPALAVEDVSRATECQTKLRKANEAGIIHDLSLEPGAVRLVVDRQTWAVMDFQTKTGMVEAVACMVTVGDRSKTARVNVFDHQNNHLVGRYDGLKLVVP